MELNLTDEQCLYLIKLIEEKLKEKLEVSSSEESKMIHNLYSKLVVQAGRDNLIK
tara:strand:+ start:1515 stop:1679 length:165 start_codon:yes stop_codon:yes gene_type:complete